MNNTATTGNPIAEDGFGPKRTARLIGRAMNPMSNNDIDITTPAGQLVIALQVLADTLASIGLLGNPRARFTEMRKELNITKHNASELPECDLKAIQRLYWKALAKTLADEQAAYEARIQAAIEADEDGGDGSCPFCVDGVQSWNSHIDDGVCYRCNGKG